MLYAVPTVYRASYVAPVQHAVVYNVSSSPNPNPDCFLGPTIKFPPNLLLLLDGKPTNEPGLDSLFCCLRGIRPGGGGRGGGGGGGCIICIKASTFSPWEDIPTGGNAREGEREGGGSCTFWSPSPLISALTEASASLLVRPSARPCSIFCGGEAQA